MADRAGSGDQDPVEEGAQDGIVTNDGTFSWEIPNERTGHAHIKVTDAYNTNCTDINDESAEFDIIGDLDIFSPEYRRRG